MKSDDWYRGFSAGILFVVWVMVIAYAAFGPSVPPVHAPAPPQTEKLPVTPPTKGQTL